MMPCMWILYYRNLYKRLGLPQELEYTGWRLQQLVKGCLSCAMLISITWLLLTSICLNLTLGIRYDESFIATAT
jgi:hypothetical protein